MSKQRGKTWVCDRCQGKEGQRNRGRRRTGKGTTGGGLCVLMVEKRGGVGIFICQL